MSNKAIFATFLYDAWKRHYFQALLILTVHTNRYSLLLITPHPSVISSCLKLWDMTFLSSVHKIKTEWAHCCLWRFMSVFLHFITQIITWCEHGNIFTKIFMLVLQMNMISKKLRIGVTVASLNFCALFLRFSSLRVLHVLFCCMWKLMHVYSNARCKHVLMSLISHASQTGRQ